MVERSYKCDLCRDHYEPGDARLVGFSFAGATSGLGVKYADARQTERHLCIYCVRGMVSLAKEARKHGHDTDLT